MKQIYILGASGLIGSALMNNLELKNKYVIGTYSKNKNKNLQYFDLNNDNYSIFNNIKNTDVVFIMSAYSNPNWIYQNQKEAKNLNFTKTINLINFLKSKNPKIVFMSSVEVFDGIKGSYTEEDMPKPLNFYGKLKFDIEKYLETEYPNHCIVRTGWNVGLNSKSRCVIELTFETLLKSNAKMAADNFFSLADVDNTAESLSKLIDDKEIKKIHFCSDMMVSRTELANLIIENSSFGKEMFYENCLFKEIQYSEPRGRVNNLINDLSKNKLNILYKNTKQIIVDKVLFLDKLKRKNNYGK